MSDRFSIDPDAVAKVAVQIRSNAEEYHTIATKLLQLATTMGSAYDSDDNRAFVNQIEGCTDDLKAMVDKLTVISTILDKQQSNFVAVSEHNSQEVRKLQN